MDRITIALQKQQPHTQKNVMTRKAAPEQLSFAGTEEESPPVPEAVTPTQAVRDNTPAVAAAVAETRASTVVTRGWATLLPHLPPPPHSHVHPATVITNINMMRRPISQHDVHSCATESSPLLPPPWLLAPSLSSPCPHPVSSSARHAVTRH